MDRDHEVDEHKKISIKRFIFMIDKHGKLRHDLYSVHA